jgi:hypothetical protein
MLNRVKTVCHIVKQVEVVPRAHRPELPQLTPGRESLNNIVRLATDRNKHLVRVRDLRMTTPLLVNRPNMRRLGRRIMLNWLNISRPWRQRIRMRAGSSRVKARSIRNINRRLSSSIINRNISSNNNNNTCSSNRTRRWQGRARRNERGSQLHGRRTMLVRRKHRFKLKRTDSYQRRVRLRFSRPCRAILACVKAPAHMGMGSTLRVSLWARLSDPPRRPICPWLDLRNLPLSHYFLKNRLNSDMTRDSQTKTPCQIRTAPQARDRPHHRSPDHLSNTTRPPRICRSSARPAHHHRLLPSPLSRCLRRVPRPSHMLRLRDRVSLTGPRQGWADESRYSRTDRHHRCTAAALESIHQCRRTCIRLPIKRMRAREV